MTAADREKWDQKYRQRSLPTALAPAPWLVENRDLLPPGRGLDLATGLGHNAIWLAAAGWEIAACDISTVGLELAAKLAAQHGATVDWRCCDLDEAPLETDCYDVIVCTAFRIEPPLAARVIDGLRPGGMLVYEAFTRDQLAQPGNHFRDDRFLMTPGEPLARFAPLRVRRYRDGVYDGRAVASLAAEKAR